MGQQESVELNNASNSLTRELLSAIRRVVGGRALWRHGLSRWASYRTRSSLSFSGFAAATFFALREGHRQIE